MIDRDEFIDFVDKLDENKTISEGEVKSQFENHDSNERNALDKIEFGVALHSLIKFLRKDIENAAEEEDEDDQ